MLRISPSLKCVARGDDEQQESLAALVMGYAMARQEAVIASKRLLEVMRNPRPKFAIHPGVTSPNIDAGGFRSPQELWIEFDIT